MGKIEQMQEDRLGFCSSPDKRHGSNNWVTVDMREGTRIKVYLGNRIDKLAGEDEWLRINSGFSTCAPNCPPSWWTMMAVTQQEKSD